MISLKISEYISYEYVKTKEILRSTEEITEAVAREVFSTLLEYTKDSLPYIVFHAIHIWQPDLIAYITHTIHCYGREAIFIVPPIAVFYFSLNYLSQPKKNAYQLIQALAPIAIVTELAVNILFPPSLVVHLTVRGIVLLSGALSNMRSLKNGAYKIHQGLTNAQLKTSEKVAKVVSGLILIGLGAFGLNKVTETSTKLYRGLKAFTKLDSTQQSFALKYYALESLGEQKSQKAVIINGFSGEWGEEKNYYYDNTPRGPSYLIYQNYNTRTYEVKSAKELSLVLEQARNELGGELDLIALMGHANKSLMVLNKGYYFTGTQTEIDAISKNLSKNGEVLLWGCNTASRKNSLTELISRKLPSRLVTGFNDLLYPVWSWSWYDKKLCISAWTDEMSSIVKTFLNGRGV